MNGAGLRFAGRLAQDDEHGNDEEERNSVFQGRNVPALPGRHVFLNVFGGLSQGRNAACPQQN